MRGPFSVVVITVAFVISVLPESGFAQSDTRPPSIVSLSFTPDAIDVTTGPQNVSVTARLTDNLSGVADLGFVFTPSSTTQSSQVVAARISGTVLDGTWHGNVPIPQFARSGEWRLRVPLLRDAAGNNLLLRTHDLQNLGFPTALTVISNEDLEPPKVIDLTFSPSAIDVSVSRQSVTVTARLADDLSGVALSHGVAATLVSPTGLQRRYLTGEGAGGMRLSSGMLVSGDWSGTLIIPPLSESGTWMLESLQLRDAAGNFSGVTQAELADAGLPSTFVVNSVPADVTAPQITALTFDPAIIDTSTGPQTVSVAIQIFDDLAGVDFSPPPLSLTSLNGIAFQSPSGQQVSGCCFSEPTFTLIDGTPENGLWQGTVVFPQFAEAGTWKAGITSIRDHVQNLRSLTTSQLEAAGLSTDLVVNGPSYIPDGTVNLGGGTVEDTTFGNRASVIFGSGAVSGVTTVAIDVLATGSGLPAPPGFTIGSSWFNVFLTPMPSKPFFEPGVSVVLPLHTYAAPGTVLSLYRFDRESGLLTPEHDATGANATGLASPDGLSATFHNLSRLATVVALIPDTVVGEIVSR